MARPDKASAVAELADRFRTSSATVLTEYRGLSVAQLKELRRSLGDSASYSVVKNTLTKIAAKEAGIGDLDELLVGPSALAFVDGDVVQAAKGLKDFAKAHPALVIKGGYLDGKLITAAEISKLAELESREVLLAKLAGAMNASLQQAVSLFAAPLSQAVRTVDALRAKVEAEGGASAAAADLEPATAPATPVDAPATTVVDAGAAATAAAATATDADASAAAAAASPAETDAEARAAAAEARDHAPEVSADAPVEASEQAAEVSAEASVETSGPSSDASSDSSAGGSDSSAGGSE